METKQTSEGPKVNCSHSVAFGCVAVVVVGAIAGLGIYKVYAKTATDKFVSYCQSAEFTGRKSVEKIPYTAFVEDLQAINTMRAYDKTQRDSGLPRTAVPSRSYRRADDRSGFVAFSKQSIGQ